MVCDNINAPNLQVKFADEKANQKATTVLLQR